MEMNKYIKNLQLLYTDQTKGYIMIFMAGVLWGTIGYFVKNLTGVGASSELTAFMRLFMGFWILAFVMICKGGISMFKIDKSGLIYCMALGLLTQAMFNYLYNMSIGRVGVATASILLYTSPVFVCVMSSVLFKENINKQKIIALILNIFGCFLMVTGGSVANFKLSFIGIILGLISAFLYSLVSIIGKITSSSIHPFTIVFYSFLFGWLSLGAYIRPWYTIIAVSSVEFWTYSFGFGLIPTVGAYLLYMGGLKKNLELARVPIIASVETVVATLLGVFIFRESIGVINTVGMGILILSIAIMNYKFKQRDNL